MLELELHALKTELQSTLAHLGNVCVSSEDDVDSRDRLNISSVAATAATNDTQRSWRRPRRTRNFDSNRPVTRWNRRQLTQELAAASERRRDLEMQLQREMEKEQDQAQQRDQRRSSRKSAWQVAILELQQQQAQIQRQIEHTTAVDAAGREEREDMRQSDVQETEQSNRNQGLPPTITRPFEILSNSETQYSIGGVVTLEPLSLSQQPQVSAMRTEVSSHPSADVTSVAKQVRDTHSRRYYRSTPDALNDVFLLQLKFAETMSKLEKSVQIRDQLLQHDRTSSLPKRRTGTQLIGQMHRRSIHKRQSFTSEASSDSSVVYREKHSDESFSSSAYSFSSLDSTPKRGQTVRMGHQHFGVSRATTDETLAPSTMGADYSRNEEVTDRVSTVSASNTTQSRHESPEDNQNSVAEYASSDEQSVTHRTPTTESSATTPTTGSDQKSTSSLSKQVRFGDDAYSTPVLARKFNFDGPSIDEDEYEEKEEEAGSVLSFLGGSSVTSAELNDVSFLRAFERFRRELNVSRLNSVTQSPLQLPLARKLFSEQSVSKTIKTTNIAPRVFEEDQGNAVESTGEADACDSITAFQALDGLSIEELQVRRRQLCLDIQAESAQLVLNLGGVQNVIAGSQDAEQTQKRLLTMRDGLKAVDKLLESLV